MNTDKWAWLRNVEGAVLPPEPAIRTKRREKRVKSKDGGAVREYVFARERNIDRVTRFLPAHSRHELRFKSLGGKVTRQNCVAVHGDGVNGTHGLLQRNEISYAFEDDALGAEGTVIFTAKTQKAADWMRIKVGDSIVSPPMVQMEMAE